MKITKWLFDSKYLAFREAAKANNIDLFEALAHQEARSYRK